MQTDLRHRMVLRSRVGLHRKMVLYCMQMKLRLHLPEQWNFMLYGSLLQAYHRLRYLRLRRCIPVPLLNWSIRIMQVLLLTALSYIVQMAVQRGRLIFLLLRTPVTIRFNIRSQVMMITLIQIQDRSM